MSVVILIVGKSLSGKTHLQRTLEEQGIEPLLSRTTRPRRFKDETGYKFMNFSDYANDVDKGRAIADRVYTVATGDMWAYWLNEDDFDFEGVKSLVIDPKGFKQIYYSFPEIEMIPVFIEPGFLVRMERYVTQRSFENENEVLRRIIADEEDFNEISEDETITTVRSEEEALRYIDFKLENSNF